MENGKCTHINKYLKVVDVSGTCETTVEACLDCGIEIEGTLKTEC